MPYSIVWIYVCQKKGGLIKHSYLKYALDLTYVFTISASSLTAMETWVVGCLVFVFFALVEYGAVLKVMSTTQEKADEVQDEAKAMEVKKKQRTIIAALQGDS